ncbi:armadillo-type protein [Syncephalis fuscata]|nr:armadillo-type protein [Syncephalis fuscata]
MTLSQVSGQQLTFNAPLLKGNRLVALNDLLKRLKQLHGELADLEQEVVDIDSLSSVTNEILSPLLFNHKDRGVRAYTACCIADLLRLYAPDAPYVEQELKEVFTLFYKQLEYLDDTQSGYHDLYLYLLESLATVKSIAIVVELQDCDDIIVKFFTGFFKVIKADTPQTVRMCMVDILGQLIEESSYLPQDAVDTILSHFLNNTRANNPPAYQMASELCNNNVDRLQRYACQYFTDVLLASNKTDTLTETTKKEIKSAHQLIVELHRVAPGLLLNVIPQLEEELSLSNTYLRRQSSLVEAYPSTWKAWLSRKNDKSTMVRTAWTEYLTRLYTNHPELAIDLNESALAKLVDPEEKVRAVACQALGTLEADVILQYVDTAVLEQLGHRCRDKKIAPRVEALKALGRMYKLTYNRSYTCYLLLINRDDHRVKEKMTWIPKEFLNILYSNDNEMIATMEAFFMRDIVSLEGSAEERACRLIYVTSGLDSKAQKALLSLLQRKAATIKEMQLFIDYCKCCNTQNNEMDSPDKDSVISNLSNRLPESMTAVDSLNKFSQLNDERAMTALEACMDPSLSFEAIQRHKRDSRKRIEHASSDMSDTFTLLIRRISYDIVHYSIIPIIIQQSVEIDEVGQDTAMNDSSSIPFLLKDCIQDIIQFTTSIHDHTTLDGLDILAACSSVYPEMIPLEQSTMEYLLNKCRFGTVKEAKKSAILLAHSFNEFATAARQTFIEASRVVLTIKHEIHTLDPENSEALLPRLSALRTLALYLPEQFASSSQVLVRFIVKEIIMKDNVQHKITTGETEDWIEFDDLSITTQCKILGMKVLVNRLCGLVEDETAEDLVQPVLRLLFSVLSKEDRQEGEEEEEEKEEEATTKVVMAAAIHRSWIRLTAGKLLLRLCRHSKYDAMILNNEFRQLALVLEDHSPYVREGMAEKLLKYLRGRLLHVRFMSVLLLLAHEPERTLRQQAKTYLRQQLVLVSTTSSGKPSLFEMSITRLIHLLAHHPDFSLDTETLNHFSKYLNFFIECCVSAVNISFVFHIVTRLKTVCDIEPMNDQSENIYVLSDLAQLIIHERCTSHQWVLTTYPASISLPRDLFRRLSTSTIAETLRKNYLPSDYLSSRKIQHRNVMSTKRTAIEQFVNQRDTNGSHVRSGKIAEKRRRTITEDPTTPVRRNAPRAARANSKVIIDNTLMDENINEMSF